MHRLTVKIAAFRVTFSRKEASPYQPHCVINVVQEMPVPGCVVISKRMVMASPRSVGRWVTKSRNVWKPTCILARVGYLRISG